MVYMVFDGNGFPACVSQDWFTARRVLSRLCRDSIRPPKMEIYPEWAFTLEVGHE